MQTKASIFKPAASFERVSAAFFWHSLIPIMIHPTRAGLIRYFRWMTQGNQVDRDWAESMLLGILNMHPQTPIRATVFSDAELRRMEVPTC